MKKLLALLMAALMLTGAAFAEEDDWYLDTAEELAACVGEVAGDEACLLYTSAGGGAARH